MAFSRTLGWASGGGSDPSGYRLRRQRYAAKLIAFALFSSVRSTGCCRRFPWLSVVPTAISSYAAHASYMHVCAIARARATIGGPLRNDLLKRTSAKAAAFQSLTTVAHEEVAHRSTVTSVARAITRGNRTGPLQPSFGPLRHRILCRVRSIVNAPRDSQPLLPDGHVETLTRRRSDASTIQQPGLRKQKGSSTDGGDAAGASCRPSDPSHEPPVPNSPAQVRATGDYERVHRPGRPRQAPVRHDRKSARGDKRSPGGRHNRQGVARWAGVGQLIGEGEHFVGADHVEHLAAGEGEKR